MGIRKKQKNVKKVIRNARGLEKKEPKKKRRGVLRAKKARSVGGGTS